MAWIAPSRAWATPLRSTTCFVWIRWSARRSRLVSMQRKRRWTVRRSRWTRYFPGEPDLCVSGINQKQLLDQCNLFRYHVCLMEGAIEGIPLLDSHSWNYSLDADFSGAAHVARIVVSRCWRKVCRRIFVECQHSEFCRGGKGIKIRRQAMAKVGGGVRRTDRSDQAPSTITTGKFVQS